MKAAFRGSAAPGIELTDESIDRDSQCFVLGLVAMSDAALTTSSIPSGSEARMFRRDGEVLDTNSCGLHARRSSGDARDSRSTQRRTATSCDALHRDVSGCVSRDAT